MKLSPTDLVEINNLIGSFKEKIKKDIDGIADPSPIRRDSIKNVITNLHTDSALLSIKSYLIKIIYGLDSNKINQFLQLRNLEQIQKKLPDLLLVTDSYFWLGDEKKYYEVLFWALFGVLCNLIFTCSVNISKKQFCVTDLPVYLAKIFYAPIVTLIIIWGFNQLTASSINFEDSSYGFLCISFILGFSSSRAVDLLDKIKNTVFPGPGTSEESKQSSIPLNLVLAGEVLEIENVARDKWVPGDIEIIMKSIPDDNTEIDIPVEDDFKFVFKKLKEGKYEVHCCYKHDTKLKFNEEFEVNKDKPEAIINVKLRNN